MEGAFPHLALEMIKGAVNDILNGTYPKGENITVEQLHSMQSARYWIYEQDSEFPDYPLSFNKICNALGLERAIILERLEEKLQEFHATRTVAKKLGLNGSCDAVEVRQKAKEYVETQMRQFGHEVEIEVNMDMTIECSKPHLETLCKNVLGV